MGQHSVIVYILLAIMVTNLIRVTPMVLIRGQIRNRFVRSFLYYVPYVTLAVMTFPAIIEATDSPLSGLIALAVGLAAAWFRADLLFVAVCCCASVLLTSFF